MSAQPPVSPPFDDSRRLTGYNLYFADAGAVLETVGVAVDDALLDEWRTRVRRMRDALGWPDGAVVARVHSGGASLALAAPLDQLFSATELNEWAWLSSLRMRVSQPTIESAIEGFHAPGHAAAWDEESALHTLKAYACAERNPALAELVQSAQARELTVLIDDETISLGVGSGARSWNLAELPDPAQINWNTLHEAPIALVTGSNGKTTTVRLLAAFMRAYGWRTAHTCTDGVFVGNSALAAGDYSGPAGARVALRQPDVDAVVLETARGGILRRGIAVQHADVAIVTNISADHFGEYGVHDLDDLAAVKLAVARVLGDRGTLVLNADDPLLVRHAELSSARRAWFSLDAGAPLLQSHRARGGSTCGVRGGHLHLHNARGEHDLGAISAMPLSLDGAARFNIANIAAATLAADALGIEPSVVRDALTQFGAKREDNPGRLQHWSIGGVEIFVDYAHNPDGLRGLLDIVKRTRRGRLGLLLGQAGNREDAEIRELAAVAAEFEPDVVILKDIGSMLRGRIAGEVPALLRGELLRHGFGEDRIVEHLDEYEAARIAIAWAKRGDVVVLPIHSGAAKPRVDAWLDELAARPVSDLSPRDDR